MSALDSMNLATPAFPLAAKAMTPFRARAEIAGSGDLSPRRSGQNPAGCREIPAARLTQELASCLLEEQGWSRK